MIAGCEFTVVISKWINNCSCFLHCVCVCLCFRNSTSCSVLVPFLFLRNLQCSFCIHLLHWVRLDLIGMSRLNVVGHQRMPFRHSSVRVPWLTAPSAAGSVAECFHARSHYRLIWELIQVRILSVGSKGFCHQKCHFLTVIKCKFCQKFATDPEFYHFFVI